MLRTPRSMISLSVMTATCFAFCFALLAAEIRPPDAIFADTKAGDVVVGKDTLDQYVGYYQIFNNLVLTITRRGDQLLAQVSDGPRFPIFPSAQDKFFVRGVDIQFGFITDGQGNVSAVNLIDQGFSRRLARIDSDTAKQHAAMLATKIRSHVPDPRSKAALLQLLSAIKIDKPDYRGVPPGAAALAQKEIFGNKELVHGLVGFTDASSLKFSNVTSGGGDTYQLKLGNTTWCFDIYLDNNGNVVAFNPWVLRHR